MNKVRHIKYHVCTADGVTRIFKTKSTADYFAAVHKSEVTSFTPVVSK